MPTALRNLFDAIVSALGGGYDKPPQPGANAARTCDLPPPIPPRADGTPDIVAMNGLRITAADCRVCGHRLKPGGDKQFCSWECERRLSDSMDAWHDQFEERFGED